MTHGSFFETIKVEDLINQAFSQVLDERLKATGEEISSKFKEQLLSLFSEQHSFSKVRDVEKASVKIRFRIMTEVKSEGNILNSKKYPQYLNYLEMRLDEDRSCGEWENKEDSL